MINDLPLWNRMWCLRSLWVWYGVLFGRAHRGIDHRKPACAIWHKAVWRGLTKWIGAYGIPLLLFKQWGKESKGRKERGLLLPFTRIRTKRRNHLLSQHLKIWETKEKYLPFLPSNGDVRDIERHMALQAHKGIMTQYHDTASRCVASVNDNVVSERQYQQCNVKESLWIATTQFNCEVVLQCWVSLVQVWGHKQR